MSRVLVVMLAPESVATMRWVRELLTRDCGLRPTEYEFAYLLDEPARGASGRPTAKQLEANRARFRARVEASSADVVIAMGPYVFRHITGLGAGIEDARGYILPYGMCKPVIERELQQIGLYKSSNKARGVKVGDPRSKLMPVSKDPPLPPGCSFVVPTYSAEMVQKSGYKLIFALKSDFSKAASLVNAAAFGAPFDDDGLVYWTNLEQTRGFGDFNGTYRPEIAASSDYTSDLLAFDIETAGKNSRVITCVSLSDGELTHTLKWCEETRAYVQRQIELAVERGALLVAHNIQFDVPILREHGVSVPEGALTFDTMFGAVNLQPDLPKGLGKVASLYLRLREPWKWPEIAEVDPEHYSAKDSFITARVARKMIEIMKGTGWYDRFVTVIMDRVRLLMDLGEEGIRVDRAALAAWNRTLSRGLWHYERLWGRAFPGLNPHSTQQLAKLFFNEWGLPVQRNLREGITTDELACVNLRECVVAGTRDKDSAWEKDPRCTPRVFDLLLKIRFESKELKTYAKAQLDEHSRVYPKYLPEAKDRDNTDGRKRKGAAATGRLASRDPNLQNPSKGARRVFIPDRDDMCFIQWDYRSAEPAVIGWLSGDKRLLEALAAGRFHQRNADEIGCERRTAKNVFFGSCYGAGPATISDTIKRNDHIFVPVAECKRVQNRLYQLYPDAFSYLTTQGTLAVEQGYLVNPFGRVRFFYGGTRDIPAAKDNQPQSTVADMIWDVMRPMSDMLRRRGGRFTTTTHDSILGQVPKSAVVGAIAEGRAIMQREFPQVAPGFFCPVDVEVGWPGASWGNLVKEAEFGFAA